MGISPTAYEVNAALASNFTVLGTNRDENGTEFVSLIESRKELGLYWYGSQFHPEKNSYEFDSHKEKNHIVHSADAVLCGSYFAQFFVNECRMRNDNAMSLDMYRSKVVYNDVPYFVEYGEGSYEQVYNFEKPVHD